MNTQKNKPRLIPHLIPIFIMALLCLAMLPKSSHAKPTVDYYFMVDSIEDYSDPSPDGECLTDDVCTLREAIQESNAIGSGNKIIVFNSSLTGKKITPSTLYGGYVITGTNITIDGGSIDGSLTINADNVCWVNLFEVTGDYNTIYDLTLQGPSTSCDPADASGHAVRIYDNANYNLLDHIIIYGFIHDGIQIVGNGEGASHHNTVSYSLIGNDDWNATSCNSNNGEEGIEIANGADYTTINNNRIVCNKNSGIYLNSSISARIEHTTIQANYIGSDGDNKMANIYAGIADTQSFYTTINGNLISGNGREGIWLNGTENGTIIANKIGVDQYSTAALANGLSGVVLTNNSNTNNIGSSTDSNSRNIISGNGSCGIEFGNGAWGNGIDGNYIGLGGADGMTVVPNGLGGVCFFAAGSNVIGDSDATVNQFISGNTREGVYAWASAGISINSSTYIGVKGDSSTPAGNGWEGVYFDTDTTNSLIYPAKVMYNGLAGIVIYDDGVDFSTGNQIRPGQVAYNGGIAIDLGGDGHTPNYSKTPPGPNNWIHYPVFYNYSGSGFIGNTCPGCYVQIYKVIGNPIANQGGGIYLTSVPSDLATGNFNYTFPSNVLAVTMQTYDIDGSLNCSELSPMVLNPNNIRNFLPFIIR